MSTVTDRLQVILDLPAESSRAGTDFWARALGAEVGEPWRDHPEFVSFLHAEGAPYVSRQQVGDHAGVHLDLEVSDIGRGVRELTDLGATSVKSTPDWHTLTSPGGLPVCLIRAEDRPERTPPVTWPTGHRSRLVQVCIDCPPARLEREAEFWRAVTGWRWQAGGSPEFVGKLFPRPGSPIQLLLHRLGEDDGATAVRAHLDLGTDDLELEADRLVGLGATRLWDGSGWITLRDPAGLLFCATHNSPDAP